MKTLFYAIVVLFLGGMTTMTQAQVKVVANGNVGIGEDNPAQKLHVNGNAEITGAFMRIGANVGPGAGAKIEFGENRTTDGPAVIDLISDASNYPDFGVRFSRNELGNSTFQHRGDGNLVFKCSENATIFFQTNGINRFLAKTSGLVPGGDGVHDLGSSTERWDDVWAVNGTIQTSDRRLKTKIFDLDYGLDEIMKLHPVSYYWKDNPEIGRKIGLIAQEVQPIIGEVVKSTDVRSDGTSRSVFTPTMLGMNYSELVPVVVRAIQEQQGQIDERDDRITELERENELLRDQLDNLDSKVNELYALLKEDQKGFEKEVDVDGKAAYLKQNQPNPFSTETQISFFLPEITAKTYIEILNETGVVIETIPVTEAGNGKVTVRTENLSPGVYIYRLVQGNTPIDTKSMILTR